MPSSQPNTPDTFREELQHINGWCFDDCELYNSFLAYRDGESREDTNKMTNAILAAISKRLPEEKQEVIYTDFNSGYNQALHDFSATLGIGESK